MRKLRFLDLLGKRTLIYGEVGTGKTSLTVRLLEEAVRLDYSQEITIVDMAPRNTVVNGIRVGGRLSEVTNATQKLRYLTPRRIETPRLSAASGKELLELIEKNGSRIRRLLQKYREKPTPILFINDISIYLQCGDVTALDKTISTSSTFIANGYYGKTLTNDFSTGISTLERELMNRLIAMMDLKINLT